MTQQSKEPAGKVDEAAETDAVATSADAAGTGELTAKERFRAALDAKHAAAHPEAGTPRRGGSAGPHAGDGAHKQRVFRRKSGG